MTPHRTVQNDVLIIWRMEYSSGEPRADRKEITETRFMELEEALEHELVGGWTKEILKRIHSGTGFAKNAYQPNHSNHVKEWEWYT